MLEKFTILNVELEVQTAVTAQGYLLAKINAPSCCESPHKARKLAANKILHALAPFFQNNKCHWLDMKAGRIGTQMEGLNLEEFDKIIRETLSQ